MEVRVDARSLTRRTSSNKCVCLIYTIFCASSIFFSDTSVTQPAPDEIESEHDTVILPPFLSSNGQRRIVHNPRRKKRCLLTAPV